MIPKPKYISKYKKNLFKTKKVQNYLKEIMPEYLTPKKPTPVDPTKGVEEEK